MDFSIDFQIEMNKERLKHEHENLRNIQNAYGYIVIYLTFIGFTFFDFILYIKNILVPVNVWDVFFLICIVLSLILIVATICVFLKLFIPQKVAHELTPRYIFNDMFNDVSKWANVNNKDPYEETKISYLKMLEKAVDSNFELYAKKRGLLYLTIKFALVSLIPYFFSMVLYYILK